MVVVVELLLIAVGCLVAVPVVEYHIYQGLPRDRFLTSGPNPAGLSYRGTSAVFFCTGSSNHGTEIFCLYGNRQPRD